MIRDPNFSLALDDGWCALPSGDSGLYRFRDAVRGIALELSAVAQDILPGDLDRQAWLLVDREIEKATLAVAALGQAATIYEPIVAPQPWGRAVAFHGDDAGGRRFGFSGIITRRCRIGLTLSTGSLAESVLLAVMDEVSSKIVFDRTPLEKPVFL